MIFDLDRLAALFGQLSQSFASSLSHGARVLAQLTPEQLFWLSIAIVIGVFPLVALVYQRLTTRRTHKAEAAAARTARLLTHEVIPFLTAYKTLLTQQPPTRMSPAMQPAIEGQLLAFIDLVRALTGRDLLDRTRAITLHDLYEAVQPLTLSLTDVPHASAEEVQHRIDAWKSTVLTQGWLSVPTRITFKTRGSEAFLEALAQDLTRAVLTPPLPSQQTSPEKARTRSAHRGSRRRRRGK